MAIYLVIFFKFFFILNFKKIKARESYKNIVYNDSIMKNTNAHTKDAIMANLVFDKYTVFVHDKSMVNPVTGKRQILNVPMDNEILNEWIFPMIKGHEVEVKSHRNLLLNTMKQNKPMTIKKPGTDGKLWGVIAVLPKSWNADKIKMHLALSFDVMDAQNGLGQ